MKLNYIFIVLFSVLFGTSWAQEDNPFISIEIPSSNMLKFNRFMINPTFSTVRENKSYINFYHRNQWVEYDDTFSTYLVSYSGRIGDRTGLGLSLYQQKFGTITNFGILSNYAYGVKLADKYTLTMGFNLSYYSSGFDQNNAVLNNPNDPFLSRLETNPLLGVSPGFNLAMGSFDLGIYAENLFDYNFKLGQRATSFSDKPFSAHLQYTRKFKSTDNLFKGGRLMTLVRGRKQQGSDITLSGSLVMDLPRIGWLQTGYDDYYGISVGAGFNLSSRISIGYTYEKGLSNGVDNLGPTHEIFMAYSFNPTLTDKMVLLNNGEFNSPQEEMIVLEQEYSEGMDSDLQNDFKENSLVETYRSDSKTFQEENLDSAINSYQKNKSYNSNQYKKFGKKERALLEAKDKQIAILQSKVEENSAIIDQLLYMQDSIDQARVADAERRFSHLMAFINKKGLITEGNSIGHTKYINKKQSKAPEILVVTKSEEKNNQQKDAYTELASVQSTLKDEVYNNFSNAELKVLEQGDSELLNLAQKMDENNQIAEELTKREILKDQENRSYMEQRFEEVMNIVKNSSTSKIVSSKKRDYINNQTNLQNVSKQSSGKIMNQSNAIENADTNKKPKFIGKKKIYSGSTESSPKANSNKEMAKYENVRFSEATNMDGVQNGYYIIANVYKTDYYFNRFMQTLANKGLESDFFLNRKNSMKYVYLKRFDTWQDAVASYKSNVGGTYEDDIWIMKVYNTDLVNASGLTSTHTQSISQDDKLNEISGNGKPEDITVAENTSAKNYTTNETEYAALAKKESVKYSESAAINGAQSGFYIIANVFKTDFYFNKFIKNLSRKGLESHYFINEKNNMKYVYLKRFDSWQEAISSYKSNVNGTYKDDIWIMKVDVSDGETNAIAQNPIRKPIVFKPLNNQMKKHIIACNVNY